MSSSTFSSASLVVSDQVPAQRTPSQNRNKRSSRSYTPVGTRSRAKKSIGSHDPMANDDLTLDQPSIVSQTQSSHILGDIQSGVGESISPPQSQSSYSTSSTALQVTGSIIPLRPGIVSAPNVNVPLNRASTPSTVPAVSTIRPPGLSNRASGPSTVPSAPGQFMFGGGGATLSTSSSQYTPSLSEVNGLLSAVEAEPSSFTYESFLRFFPLPHLAYPHKGSNATFDLKVSDTISDMDAAYMATIQEMFSASCPSQEIKSLRNDYLSIRSQELETLMKSRSSFDPLASLLKKIEAKKSINSTLESHKSTEDISSYTSYSALIAGSPQPGKSNSE